MCGLDALGAAQNEDARGTRPYVNPAILAILGAVSGGLLSKKHRTLGVFVGSAVGAGVVAPIWNSGSLWDAASAIVFSGAGYAVSLLWKSHPVLGFIGGTVLGELAIAQATGRSLKESWGYMLAGEVPVK